MTTPGLQLKDVSYRYPRASKSDYVIREATVDIPDGEAVGLVGPNGSGKSTLLKVLANLLRPTSGEILYQGRRLKVNDQAFRASLNYCAGAPQGFYPRLTGGENLRFFSGMKGRMFTREEAEVLLETVGLKNNADTVYSKFSLGMRQRLHIACLLIEPASLWILDEPTTGLDAEGVEMLESILSRSTNKTRIIVSHDADFIDRMTTRRIVIEGGGLKCHDSSFS
ncbi:ABC transporter ATP-binding protein [Streptomyces sp. V1I1]|uniref:ABC transporter ATP-binding protein n=1 Tax=Streptomyces sp. V1I1 TaxID=3042272 RepID=UPI0027854FF2|nr:ABC transporter ATP-binding protein [Streptomyces sp. V1I1]MDQ0946033.1 ABC-type multidrug transport system ATPase subunit [Streptomyces sp. V1I1]